MTSIFIVDTYYQEALSALGFGKAVPNLGSYDRALEAITDQGFGTGGVYRRELERQGWDATLAIPNSLELQGFWLRENGFSRPISVAWSYGLHLSRLPLLRRYLHLLPQIHGTLLRQIATVKPDVVLVQDLNIITPQLAKSIREHTRLLVGEIASPLPPKPYFKHYDLILSALPTIVQQARAWGINAEYLPLGFDARWSRTAVTPTSSRPIDAIFVGSFSRHQPQTIPLLQEVARLVPTLRIYGNAPPAFFAENGLLSNYAGPAWGRQMFELLGNSKVVINRHGTIAGEYAVNMRMFEATGCGALLMTENKKNLSSLFEVDVEVLAYEGAAEAAALVKEVLQDTKRLDLIAAAGQRRTLTSHTYASRAKDLTALLTRVL